jgi:hypothetical protein
MARTAIVPVKPTTAGVAKNLVAPDAVNFNNFVWRVDSILHFVVGATATTITIFTNIIFADGLALPNRVFTAITAQELYVGPFPQQEYQQADGTVWVNFSQVTAVTVEVIQPSP